METANEVFLYELWEQLDAEQSMLALLPQQIVECRAEDQIYEALRGIEYDTRQQAQNLQSCLQILGAMPQKVQSAVIRRLRQEHDAFRRQNPLQAAWAPFDLAALARASRYTTATYRGLVERAKLLDHQAPARLLLGNLRQAEFISRQIQQLSRQLQQSPVAVRACPAVAGR